MLNLLHASFVRVMSYPAAWVGLIGGAAAWPCLAAMMDYGILSNSSAYDAYMASSVFVGGLWGSALACAALGQQAWLLSQAGHAQRLAIETLVLAATTSIFAFVGLVSLMWMAPAASATAALLVAACLCSAHWSALGLVALRLPLPPVARVLVLPALGWWLPAGVETSSELVVRTARAVDPSAVLAGLHRSAETLPGILVDIAAIGALVLLATLLPTPAADR